MKMHSLEDLFKDELFDLYNAENQLTEALPKMAKAASDSELAEGFKTHLKETEGQIQRIEKVCNMLGYDMEKETCEAMKGLLEEGEELMDNADAGAVRDAAMIAAAQKVEHYEIASYGTVITLAKALGYDEAAGILAETLEEEKATDEKLTRIAEDHINNDAMQKAA